MIVPNIYNHPLAQQLELQRQAQAQKEYQQLSNSLWLAPYGLSGEITSTPISQPEPDQALLLLEEEDAA